MKETKFVMICYCVASVCFYISAALDFFGGTASAGMAVTHLCLGSTFLCLASVNIRKYNAEKEKSEQEPEEIAEKDDTEEQ